MADAAATPQPKTRYYILAEVGTVGGYRLLPGIQEAHGPAQARRQAIDANSMMTEDGDVLTLVAIPVFNWNEETYARVQPPATIQSVPKPPPAGFNAGQAAQAEAAAAVVDDGA